MSSALRRAAPDRRELLTLLMHVVAVEFDARRAEIGELPAAGEFTSWCQKVAAMLDGTFDVDTSKH